VGSRPKRLRRLLPPGGGSGGPEASFLV